MNTSYTADVANMNGYSLINQKITIRYIGPTTSRAIHDPMLLLKELQHAMKIVWLLYAERCNHYTYIQFCFIYHLEYSDYVGFKLI